MREEGASETVVWLISDLLTFGRGQSSPRTSRQFITRLTYRGKQPVTLTFTSTGKVLSSNPGPFTHLQEGPGFDTWVGRFRVEFS